MRLAVAEPGCRTVLATLLIVAGLAAPHPNSLSSSRVRIADEVAQLQIRVQVISLLEVLPALDADADGRVTPAEVRAADAEIFGYLDAHYELWVGTDREHAGGERLLARYVSLEWRDAADVDPGNGNRAGAVDVRLDYRHRAPIVDLLVHSTLFADTSPRHIDLATIEWADGTVQGFGLSAREPRGRYDPSGRGAAALFVRLGWEHILSGWDHLAFVAVLILSAASLRGLLGVITAFTLAHSITLGLAGLRLIDVAPIAGLVEPAIALSIAYVAADNLLSLKRPRSRWIEAFVFGLIHGLGFATVLGRSLLDEPSRLIGLLSFNLGVELGQIAVALGIVLLLAGLSRRHPTPNREGLAPQGLRAVLSVPLVLAGLFWFWQRV